MVRGDRLGLALDFMWPTMRKECRHPIHITVGLDRRQQRLGRAPVLFGAVAYARLSQCTGEVFQTSSVRLKQAWRT